MFCFQCQEAAKNTGCTVRGMCGKEGSTAHLQDLLIFHLKGMSLIAEVSREAGIDVPNTVPTFIAQALFTTITNANFNDENLEQWNNKAVALKTTLLEKAGDAISTDSPGWDDWTSTDSTAFADCSACVGVLSTQDEDARSLRELLIIGLKGVAAYAEHARVLGVEDQNVWDFMITALASTTKELSLDEMVGMVLKCGEISVAAMAALDKANTQAYGNPEITQVNIGVGTNPGILISGHDLKDMEELLEQTKDTGVDVYTHGEMLPAHYYPAFKKYSHLKGNYGGSWWHQNKEFEAFNGPVLMTTNCIVPLKNNNTYLNRLYTTGTPSYPGAVHIEEHPNGGPKDFSVLIEQATTCPPPQELETGSIVGGFAHNQVLALADKVVEAVKSGAIKRFVVMGGCDGRHKTRDYFTQVAQTLPKDTIILTAGCAKYRYNKLDLGDIGGIPRVLDAGQCNDSYSLAVIALKLKEVFGLEDINDLPLSFDIGWYEQKAVAVLLALLYLGVKGIRLGPTLPAFVSPNVLNVLVDTFNIKLIGDVEGDVQAMMEGR